MSLRPGSYHFCPPSPSDLTRGLVTSPPSASFPQRRESTLPRKVDSRFGGNDAVVYY